MRLRLFTVHRSLLTAYCLLLTAFFGGCKDNIKEPAVAGAFYPSDKKVLKDTVNSFFSIAENRAVDGKLIAMISPHAGYQFSGHVAAYSYNQLRGRDVKTVILIGSSHYKGFNGASVYAKGRMRTPLGDVRINERLAKALISEKEDIVFDPDAFAREHSLEVQLPFLQLVLKDFSIVPILISSPTRKSMDFLTGRLSEILRNDEKAIIIASTDLSHYHDYDTAVVMDRKIIDAVERMAIEDVERLLMSGEAEMCGGYPVILAMAVARRLGATNGILYKYANSGDVTNDRGRVVGYTAIGLYKSNLTREEKDELLFLARNTIVNYVMHRKIMDADVKSPRLRANGATFVTINKHGNLRGCIGNLQATMPLYKSVIHNAVSASSRDYRFSPMTKEELKDMEVEISILSPFEPLGNVQNIEIGKHGLYLMKGEHGGLLLPQVAKDFGWDRNTFLEQLSIKAGLPKDAWRDAQLYAFTAEIIK